MKLVRVPQKATDHRRPPSVAPRSRHTAALGRHSVGPAKAFFQVCQTRVVRRELHVGGSLRQSSHILGVSNGNSVDTASCAQVLLHVTGRSIVVDTGHINRSLISFDIFLMYWPCDATGKILLDPS